MEENTASTTPDAWNNMTTFLAEGHHSMLHADRIRAGFGFINAVIGTVGVLDNLFVVIVFTFFIKITDKVS